MNGWRARLAAERFDSGGRGSDAQREGDAASRAWRRGADLQRRSSVAEDDPERAARHDWMEGSQSMWRSPTSLLRTPCKGTCDRSAGPPDAFGVDVEIVIRKHHLPHVFPANVLAEASGSAAQTVESLTTAE